MQSGASGRVLEPMVQYSKFYLYGLISIAFEGILGLDRQTDLEPRLPICICN